MPWALILVVAGLVLVYVTTMATLGWILFSIGIVLFVVPILLFAVGLMFFNKKSKEYKKFGGW
jgi:amino acid transporter